MINLLQGEEVGDAQYPHKSPSDNSTVLVHARKVQSLWSLAHISCLLPWCQHPLWCLPHQIRENWGLKHLSIKWGVVNGACPPIWTHSLSQTCMHTLWPLLMAEVLADAIYYHFTLVPSLSQFVWILRPSKKAQKPPKLKRLSVSCECVADFFVCLFVFHVLH